MNGYTDRTVHPIAVTIGELAGIGPEITLRAWHCRESENLPPFDIAGDHRASPKSLIEALKLAQMFARKPASV